MDSACVVISGLFALILLCWIERRGKFQGPKIDWDALNASNALE